MNVGMSSLSDRYRENASLAESLNQAAVAIKKETLGIRDESDIQPMREFVLLVTGALLAGEDAISLSASPYLAPSFSDEQRARASAMSDEIERLRNRLAHVQPLETGDFETLDHLVDITGEATSRSFHELTRG